MSLTDFPALIDDFPEVDAGAGDLLNTATKEHDDLHNKQSEAIVALQRIVVGPSQIDLQAYAAGNGVDNDSAGITTALTTGPTNGLVVVPAGEYMVDPTVMRLLSKRSIVGDGGDSSWFTLRSNTSGAALAIESDGIGVRASYGTRVKGIGINLVNAPSATGIRVGEAAGDGLTGNWTHLDDIRVEGGVLSFDCQSLNTKLTNFHLLNPTTSFIKVSPTGQEFRCWDGVFEVVPGATVQVAFDIPILVGGAAGAVYVRDLALNNAGTVLKGFYEHCPNGSTASVPLRCTNVTLDNLSGPGYDLVNVTDAQIMGGWVNAASGTTNGAIRFYGGGQHTVMGVQQLNGGSSGGCSYDFAGATPTGIVLLGNAPATGPYYKLSATEKPVELLVWDRLANAAVEANITNDPAGLRAAMAHHWTPPLLSAPATFASAGATPVIGRATLVAGTVTVACANVDSTLSEFQLTRRVTGGTVGDLSIGTVTTGTSFVINSSSATETSTISWVHYR